MVSYRIAQGGSLRTFRVVVKSKSMRGGSGVSLGCLWGFLTEFSDSDQ